ncbi:MAG: hypothetical protein WC785_03800 [Tatlockia sp.]|jgi:hypothetical protein
MSKPKLITEFDRESSKSVGGVTGSVRVTGKAGSADAGSAYQLKPSILDNSLVRRTKAEGTDRENFSEFIAATLLFHLLKDKGISIPEVSLVYDRENKRVLIASKYVEGEKVQTLDEYAKEKGLLISVEGKKAHITMVAGDGAKNNQAGIDSEHIAPLKKGLTQVVAANGLVGNHDVNPGNVLVVTDAMGKSRLVAIDFGHAFNGLLNAPSILGGQFILPGNPVKDFFNREKVAGIAGGDPSKLWRDYPGLVLTEEMADSVIEEGLHTDRAIKEGLRESKRAFEDLMQLVHQDGNEKDMLGHINKTLAKIDNDALRGAPIKARHVPTGILDKVYDDLESNIIANRNHSLKTGCQLKIQCMVNKGLSEGKDISTIQQELDEFIGRMPLSDEDVSWLKNKDMYWVKETKESKPFYGTLDQYILNKKISLLQQSEPNNALNSIAKNSLDFIAEHRENLAGHKVRESQVGQMKKIEVDMYRIVNLIDQGKVSEAVTQTTKLINTFEKAYKQPAPAKLKEIELSLGGYMLNKQQSIKANLQAIKKEANEDNQLNSAPVNR